MNTDKQVTTTTTAEDDILKVVRDIYTEGNCQFLELYNGATITAPRSWGYVRAFFEGDITAQADCESLGYLDTDSDEQVIERAQETL